MINTVTLKDDFTFLVSDNAGVVEHGPQGHGLYFEDTRYLSQLELTIDGHKQQLLSFNADYNIAATFHLSLPFTIKFPEGQDLEQQDLLVAHAVGLVRRRFIQQALYESLELTNFHNTPISIKLSLLVGTDFADIFEVRGFPRNLSGPCGLQEISQAGKRVDFYSSPPGPKLSTRHMGFECTPAPASAEPTRLKSSLNGLPIPAVALNFELTLQPSQPVTLNFKVTPEPGRIKTLPENRAVTNWLNPGYPTRQIFASEVARAHRVFNEWRKVCSVIDTGDYRLNRFFETALLDLRSLMQQGPDGLVVTAGLPWYFTLFGRDSLITGLQTLGLNPQIAVDTLRSLAVHQAEKFDDWQDSEPGKILHEFRRGDLVASGEVPHGPYYGSIDSTLLFIICFSESLKWLDDPALFDELWPAVERALNWARQYGEIDHDGYIKFERRSTKGILHPGWKDSDESMGGYLGVHPEPPIALIEVQGYYYAAQVALAETLKRFGNATQQQLAAELEASAVCLKTNFNRDFWWEEESFFVQALDRHKGGVHSVTSNPGQCLWSGIVDQDKAGRLIDRLMKPDMLCGWGIRTMSSNDPTYNPMSYHNGSVWPHDNSLILAGMSRYGFKHQMMVVAEQIIAAAMTFEDYRLPELYCGFQRLTDGIEEYAPVAYPVSCSPQAWAAGTPFMILQSLLGLEVDASAKQITLDPVLPDIIENLQLTRLQISTARVGFTFRRDMATGQVKFQLSQDAAGHKIETISKPAGGLGGSNHVKGQ